MNRLIKSLHRINQTNQSNKLWSLNQKSLNQRLFCSSNQIPKIKPLSQNQDQAKGQNQDQAKGQNQDQAKGQGQGQGQNQNKNKKNTKQRSQSQSIKSLSDNDSLTVLEHAIRVIGGLPLFIGGFYTVDKNHVGIIEYFGKYYDTKKEGLQFNLPFAQKCKDVFIGLRSLNINKSKVLDKDGNPIIVSAILNYFVEDPIKYTYNIEDPLVFLENQSSAVIKDITSKYSYNELKNEANDITLEATSKIQNLCQTSGIRIDRLNFTDLSYAPEIAGQMLVKQQAMAHIEARKMIVDSSITIVKDILEKLDLDKETKNKAAVNLLTVLVSNTGAQNVVNLN